MLKAKDLVGVSTWINGEWVPALPIQSGFIMQRLSDAFAVLTGKAQAIMQK